MDIGRQALNDNEFDRKWLSIYKEIDSLYNTHTCNTTKIYNTIYSVCTSISALDNTLYWKIADYLYNRLRETAELILQQNNKITAYTEAFRQYHVFLENLNEICVFLNDCTKNKPIGACGYLLWEKYVIQEMGKDFFREIYHHVDHGQSGEVDRLTQERIVAINSLKYIVVDETDPLLYYSNKYEIIGMNNIYTKYQHIVNITSLQQYADTIYNAMAYESMAYKSYFLPESAKNIEMCLEDALFSEMGDKAIQGYKELLRSTINDQESSKRAHKDRVDCTAFLDSHYILQELKQIVEKKEEFGSPLLTVLPELSNDIPGYFKNFLQLSIFPSGFVLVKKAYSLFLCEYMEENRYRLSRSIEEVYEVYTEMAIFNQQIQDNFSRAIKPKNQIAQETLNTENLKDFCMKSDESADNCENKNTRLKAETLCFILDELFSRFMLKIKPGLCSRLCDYTEVIATNLRYIKPYQQHINSSKIFYTLLQLVSKTDFSTQYKEVLCKRILSRSSDIEKEKEIIQALEGETESGQGHFGLVSMITDVSNTYQRIRILNSIHWGFPCENSQIRLPESLIKKIKEEVPTFETRNENDKCSYTYKMKGENRQITFAHQFTKIYCRINSRKYILSIYQYILINLIQNETHISEIYKQVDLNESKIEALLGDLEERGICERNGEMYRLKTDNGEVSTNAMSKAMNPVLSSASLNTSNSSVEINNRHPMGHLNEFIDMSNVDLDYLYNRQFDMESYHLSLICGLLKKHKRLGKKNLKKEFKELNRYVIEKSRYEEIIQIAKNKGVIEEEGDEITYNM